MSPTATSARTPASQGPPGHADHARGEVAARDLEAPLRERQVDGERPAGDVHRPDDPVPAEEAVEVFDGSVPPHRVRDGVVVLRDCAVPIPVGRSVMRPQEPHAR